MSVLPACACGCGESVRLSTNRFINTHHTRRPEASRFWAKVDRRGPDECWSWLGGRGRFGRGKVRYGIFHPAIGNPDTAHRVAYRLLIGPIPKGKHLDHLCRNALCVNPAHLEVVSPAVNIRRGKAPKLTPEIVAIVRAANHTIPDAEFGRRFGVHGCTISQARRGVTWRAEPDGRIAI